MGAASRDFRSCGTLALSFEGRPGILFPGRNAPVSGVPLEGIMCYAPGLCINGFQPGGLEGDIIIRRTLGAAAEGWHAAAVRSLGRSLAIAAASAR